MHHLTKSNRSPKTLAQLVAVTIAIVSSAASATAANTTAQSTSVKIGYFNLNLVRIAYPEGRESDAL